MQDGHRGDRSLAILDSGEKFDLLTSGLMMPHGDGMFLLERTIYLCIKNAIV
jgi:hypothetical protein